eukprot:TRINITY_DN773096_c1_g1_i1.p1 TRINITY_DN773096_c1_g1~~TRINITY_DN773096_c1_g1_i1.p1  ORF type:complete len:875 (+),score=342.72 TRINITY_DN773096_c1_g1_i1:94-2718(+)
MAEPEKKIDDLGFEASALEALEKNLEKVLSELSGDESFEKIKSEFEKLHRALQKSHENEKRLIKKCRELNAEIVNNAAKVQTALKLSQEDQNAISTLKNEVKRAWEMVDQSRDKELRAKETIQKLKAEIQNLTRLVDKGAGLTIGQENTLNELQREKDDLSQKNGQALSRIQELENRNAQLLNQMEEHENELRQRDDIVKDLKEDIRSKKQEKDRDTRRKERIDRELIDLKTQLEKQEDENEDVQKALVEFEEKNKKLQQKSDEAVGAMEKSLRDYDNLYQKAHKLTKSLDEQMQRNEALVSHNNGLEEVIKSLQRDVSRGQQEVLRFRRKLDNELKKEQHLENKLGEEKTAQVVMKTEVTTMQRELDTFKRDTTMAQKKIEAMHREKDIHQKELLKEGEKVKSAGEQVKVAERTMAALEADIQRYKQEAAKQRKIIYDLEKDRQKSTQEVSSVQSQLQAAVEESQLRDVQMSELQKQLTDGEARLKQQQQMYEAVRSDRNLYSKNLVEAQDEIAELKRKFKIMNHQIEQLKEEIGNKDMALVRVHFEHQKVEKKREQQKNEISKLKKLLKDSESTIHKQDAELGKLTQLISGMDEDALQQRKEYDTVVNERDVLGTQLIRRNDELALLYEKQKIIESTLQKGEAQYRDRLQDIRILKLKIGDLKRELDIATKDGKQARERMGEIYHLQRELLQERTKVKALSEELENPMNVHRWRKLEGSDPATYEMVQKIQTLQKRLIAKTEDCVEKDLLIKEKEKMYVELKNILARQPGPEVAEQLSAYQQALRDKDSKLKALTAEFNVDKTEIQEHKFEAQRLAKALQDMKAKYYALKRRIQLDADRHQDSRIQSQLATQKNEAMTSVPRFTGGGFNLNS